MDRDELLEAGDTPLEQDELEDGLEDGLQDGYDLAAAPFEEDLDVEFTQPRRPLFSGKHGKQALAAIGVALLFSALVMVAIGVVVFLPSGSSGELGPPMTANRDPNLMNYTIEYQISLDEKLFDDRYARLQEMLLLYDDCELTLPRELDGHAPLDGSQPMFGSWETARVQQTVHKTECHRKAVFTLRQRTYVWGGREGQTTIDAKSTSLQRSEAERMRLWPSEERADRAFQKIEVDKHGCGSRSLKYGRETRITLNTTDVHLETCYDIYALFPEAITYENSDKAVSRDEDHTYFFWLFEQFGTLQAGETLYRVQTSVSHAYDTLEEAISGNGDRVKQYSEWSIRVWTADDSDDEDLQRIISTLMRNVATRWGTSAEKACI